MTSRPSHPPTLLTLLGRTLTAERPVERGAAVLVAVSGGADSMALLHVLAKVAPTWALRLAAHGVDHGLRAEAAAELDLAEALAAKLGVPFARTRVDVAEGSNVQARARTARKAALVAAADAFAGPETMIATAHHADDRAETVILRLLRGSPLRSLSPLPVRAGRFVRPLIRAPRSAIEQHVMRHGIAFASDPSNANPRFFRSRVRHEVLPLLRALDPRIADHLNALADEIAPLASMSDASSEPSDTARGSMSGGSRSMSGDSRADALAGRNDDQTPEIPALPATTPLRARRALSEAVRTQAHDSQVFLPGGLVALYDRQHLQWVVRPRRSS